MTKSLKTFFLYAIIVVLIIIISLSVKTYQIIKNSIFEGRSQFVLIETKGLEVKKIFSFDPQSQDVSIVQVTGKPLLISSLGKTLGVIPNATVLVPSNFNSESPQQLLTELLVKKQQFETKMTVYDVIRLLALVQNKAVNTYTIQLPRDQQSIDRVIKQAIRNETIVSEDNTIQLINASGIPGLATRLERALTNRGANIISVKTAHSKEARSTIRFYAEETATVTILKNLLRFQTEHLSEEGVAKVIITIGEDQQDTHQF